ncbi:MAG: glycosyltransferase [Sphingobacteriales bacterium]|nr:glycosyltransferase [Sphingobacteriales bacterium]MBI3718670.1 glycosyltransferase [Sphingobacteriales bacterium]
MTGKKLDNSKTILVAPLSWGLGHATRCIPIIHELLAQNIKVMIAGDGPVAALLTKEFPQLPIIQLKSFAIKYSSAKKWFFLKMLWQLPCGILLVYREKRWLKGVIEKYKIDAVISDNRMGLYHTGIHCVYITHQLNIKTEMGNRADKLAQQLHYHFINKFNECWVPDFEGEQNLAGELSHPIKKPATPVKYIGALSRFEQIHETAKQYDYLIILSGPEPQRTIFENILLKQIPTVEGKFLLVRGLPEISLTITASPNTTIINHLTSEELNKAIQSSSLIISRSGYTTVMDLIKLNKKAIFVPTPGQPEQEYLANHLSVNNLFYITHQENFDLKQSIEAAEKFKVSSVHSLPINLYKPVIHQFILSLTQQKIK